MRSPLGSSGRALIMVAAVLLLSFSAQAQTARSDEIFYAVDFASGSSTGGIQEAINACGLGLATTGCVVVLPRGVVSVGATIHVGVVASGDFKDKEGIVLKGHGNGVNNNTGFGPAGTTLRWAGGTAAAGTPVLKIWDVGWARFQDFAVDGNNQANIGIDYTASNPTDAGTSQQNIFENIAVMNIATVSGTKGIGVRAAPNAYSTCECQVSESSFRHLFTRDVAIGFQQDGMQTTGMRIEDSNITATYRGIEALDGLLYVHNTFFGGLAAGMDADIYIGTEMNDVSLLNNTHETCAKAAIKTVSDVTNARYSPTVLINEHIQHFGGASSFCPSDTCTASSPCYIIDHQGPGPFSMIGGYYHVNVPFTPKPLIRFANNASGAWPEMRVFSAGNIYSVSEIQWAQVTANRVYIEASDSFPAEFAAMTWDTRNVGAETDNYLVLHNTPVTGGQDIVAWMTQQANLVLRKDTGSIKYTSSNFSNSVELKADVSTGGTNTATLPPATGTVVLDVSTQSLTHKDLSDATNSFPSTLATDDGTETLTHKTLTSSTNTFPALGLLMFTNASAISTSKSRFLGPNNGLAVPTTNNDATSDVTVAAPVPALTAREFQCVASAAPGSSSKSWTMTLYVAGSASGSSCVISNTATTCSQTLSSAVATGNRISVKIQPSATAPASATVLCTLRTAS